jgi:DNA-binding transcriptional LysR family regulator
MNLNDVVTFVAVVQAGSFTLAGQQLGVPKGTVSRRIGRLETDLALRLLQRTTRRVALTEGGRALYDHCRHAVDTLREAPLHARELATAVRGTLRVAVAHGLAQAWLAPHMGEFHRRYPRVKVMIEASQAIVDLVQTGADVALRSARRLSDSGIVARRLGGADSILCATPKYLARRGTPRTLADLSAHPCFVHPLSLSGHGYLLTGPEGDVTAPIDGWLTANDSQVRLTLVRRSLGLGILGEIFVREDVAAGRLVRVLPAYREPGSIFAVYPTSRHLAPRVRAFVDFVAKLPGLTP